MIKEGRLEEENRKEFYVKVSMVIILEVCGSKEEN